MKKVKTVEERIELERRMISTFRNHKMDIQTYKDFGEYAAKSLSMDCYDYIYSLRSILSMNLRYEAKKALWEGFTSTLKEDFVDILKKLTIYLKNNQEECRLDLDCTLDDYISIVIDGGEKRGIYAEVMDIVSDSIDKILEVIYRKDKDDYNDYDIHIEDLIEDLTEEEIEKCKLLYNLRRHSIGYEYIEYFLEKYNILSYFLRQLKQYVKS